ncbi:hypothetical protein NTGM5_380002 [Candidatus Nitrotoga sp. M5]|nr:hypothetical protein NTGM5_380002 [Candidatus Nitrotoga sp. M5]
MALFYQLPTLVEFFSSLLDAENKKSESLSCAIKFYIIGETTRTQPTQWN